MEQWSSEEITERTKTRYRNQKNVKDKWIREYKKISVDGDYQRNRACLMEVFNMLDFVMQNRLDVEMNEHVKLPDLVREGTIKWCFRLEEDDRIIRFYPPTSFKSRAYALNLFGYHISEEIEDYMRRIRNVTAHGVETVVREYVKLDYEYTRSLMRKMASALINLGMLDESLIDPSFDILRVKIGETIHEGAYLIEEFVAEGGSGRVYRGRQTKLNRTVAVKELKPGSFDKDQIAKECSVLVNLKHEQIPQIIDTFGENGTYYIIMEYVDGITIQQYMSKYVIEDSDVLNLGIQLSALVGYLHQQGIIYSDIKPQNIMINRLGQLRLIDFGIARSVTQQTAVGYSTAYAAPEVLMSGRGDYRADVYAIGVLMQELLSVSLIEQNTRPRLQDVIQKCLERNPDNRYENALGLKRDLEHVSGAQKSKNEEEISKILIPKTKIVLGIVAVSGVVMLLVLFIMLITRTKQLEEVIRSYSISNGNSNQALDSSNSYSKSEVSAEKELSSKTIQESASKILSFATEGNATTESQDGNDGNMQSSYAERMGGVAIGDDYSVEYIVYNKSGKDWKEARIIAEETWIMEGGSEKTVRIPLSVKNLQSNSNRTCRVMFDPSEYDANPNEIKSVLYYTYFANVDEY